MKTLELKLKKDILIVDLEDNEATHIKGYEFLCEGSELTEEIASEFMSDFDAFNEFTFSYEYLKSFIYIIATKGFYWLENPVKIHTLASENADEYRKKWQEAEEKTFRNPLIFVKK